MGNFGLSVEHERPRLKRYAWSLTRNPDAADDLVQDCMARALAKSHLWEPGTDLAAWLLKIMHNLFVTQVRRSARQGNSIDIDEVMGELSTAPSQMQALEVRDLRRAFDRLPKEHIPPLMMAAMEGLQYDEIGRRLRIPTGTVRSRISRGRAKLRDMTGRMPVREVEASDARTRVTGRRNPNPAPQAETEQKIAVNAK